MLKVTKPDYTKLLSCCGAGNDTTVVIEDASSISQITKQKPGVKCKLALKHVMI